MKEFPEDLVFLYCMTCAARNFGKTAELIPLSNKEWPSRRP